MIEFLLWGIFIVIVGPPLIALILFIIAGSYCGIVYWMETRRDKRWAEKNIVIEGNGNVVGSGNKRRIIK